ncbi:VOC family protein [Mycobacterium sp. OTB74]|jgi:catechol 2,3-dioxygenase-like lactoylglutathione lyase family enzyme|uniref:VOC family protein n=1 Tax=Mycobacterium sp. OTB74 TaxID=1853452 RepID=UPI002474F2F5|nr:VOC family protein [Mycobacterium sp. OTB74]MDH6244428.1 glyoxylase I family protein [Mycobacterium sp. OTB74]
MTTPAPLAHIAVTVRDLAVSAPWYRALFGTGPVLDEHTDGGFHHVVFILRGNTLFGLHQHAKPAAAADFSEFNVGLDHVAFGCADRAELEQRAQQLDALGITHGGVVDAHYGSGVSFRDPDGIALEFFAPPACVRTISDC